MRSTPKPSAVQRRRRLGRRQVERRAGDADHHPPLEAALAVVGVALLRRDRRARASRRRARPSAGWCGRRRRAPPCADPRTSASARAVGRQDHVAGPEPGVARRRQRLDALHQRRQRVGHRQLELSPPRSTRTCIGPGGGHLQRDAVEILEARHSAAVRPRAARRPAASGCSTPGSASISPIVGRSVGTPCQSAMPAKTTMVSRKLKTGPASTVSIRRQTEAPWKLVRALLGGSSARAPWGRRGWSRRCRRGT